MYINWEINNEVENISLEEFENDYESFFGFIMFNTLVTGTWSSFGICLTQKR